MEGCFGLGKRKYSLDLTKARLIKGAGCSIPMAFVVMCVEEIRSLLCLFLITIFLLLYLSTAKLSLDGAQEHLAA